jgi:hypothetical protein
MFPGVLLVLATQETSARFRQNGCIVQTSSKASVPAVRGHAGACDIESFKLGLSLFS